MFRVRGSDGMRAFMIPYMPLKEKPGYCDPECPQSTPLRCHCQLPMTLDPGSDDCVLVELFGDGTGNPLRCAMCRELESVYGDAK